MLEIVTPATTGHLTTLVRVKAELSIIGTAEDLRLATLIGEASDLIAAHCNRDTFGREAVRQTERITCAQEYIILERDIALTITALTVDGTALAAADYEVDGSLLYRIEDDRRGYWDAGKVVIEYGAGFTLLTTLPYALERAALDLVVNLYRGRGRDGAIRQEMVEGIGSTSYFDPRGASGGMSLSADRVAALNRYRLVNIG